jgi:hypothetical protein
MTLPFSHAAQCNAACPQSLYLPLQLAILELVNLARIFFVINMYRTRARPDKPASKLWPPSAIILLPVALQDNLDVVVRFTSNMVDCERDMDAQCRHARLEVRAGCCTCGNP